ncbi:MAG: hypothetical protein AAF211_24335 [Myxococcota bacterium]
MVASESIKRMSTAWLMGVAALIGTGAMASALGYLAQVVFAWAGVPLL